jgi:hypothetical protein
MFWQPVIRPAQVTADASSAIRLMEMNLCDIVKTSKVNATLGERQSAYMELISCLDEVTIRAVIVECQLKRHVGREPTKPSMILHKKWGNRFLQLHFAGKISDARTLILVVST